MESELENLRGGIRKYMGLYAKEKTSNEMESKSFIQLLQT